MTQLSEIQSIVQQVAEAISAALKIETEIVDETMTVVAGTGQLRERINSKEEGGTKEAGFLYGRVLTKNQAYIIENARTDPTYDPSVLKGETEEIAEICCPIGFQGKAIGVIGLIAFTQNQHINLIEHQDQMLTFLYRMAELLATKVSETEAMKQWNITTNKIHTIIESIHEGIIAIDERGILTHCNRTGELILRRKKEKIIGQPLENILPNSPMMDVLKTGKGYVEKEEFYPSNNGQIHFIVTANPIKINNKINGVVSSFRRMSDVRRLAYSLTNHQDSFSLSDIRGECNRLTIVKEQAQQVAKSDSNILITGESGTGKGLFSRAIHFASPRMSGPFILVNCGAIPETLLESELFGYTKGAFTGANREGKIGKFEMADNGTIFLDEIGDLPLHLQVKLLHVIQNKVIERVGSGHPIPVNVRLIAATNKNLEEMVTQGEFRSDLFFRLNVIPLHIPPLRERKTDIPMLMEHFLIEHTQKLDKEIVSFSSEVVKIFKNYHWPGNVRELENAVEYAVNMVSDSVIQKENIPHRMIQTKHKKDNSLSLKTRLLEYEGEILREMLKRYGNTVEDKSRIASELKISLATLYRKMEENNLLKYKNFF
ncbi:sigma-54-dependent Fis family transcriptional regulator [Pseudalkalibacillus decolorationis]|uniref:sigma-54-dependent Fis family transcriptional regulator n=1 Tax=Pseudalkalibacillus decolorationis TaxID=163879 RepID=UPI0021482685|nr:sigma 54-interacting transcriptional regulator [Pseudalkalibacillus decolorationis]